MTYRYATQLLLLTLFTVFPCQPLHAKKKLEIQVDRLAEPYIENEIVIGMTIGVVKGDDSGVYSYGKLSTENSAKPDRNTVYEIGSVSKVFTGILLADAVSQGRVELDQPAGDLLPKGVKMPSKADEAITLKHLSTHTSGLPRLPDNLEIKDPENPYADYTVKDLVKFLKSHKVTRVPGEKSEYSNLAVGLLGNLLAHEAHTSYEKLLKSRVAKPLGMKDTTIKLNRRQKARLAPPYQGDGQPTSNWDLLSLAGAGAIRSTADDMLKFVKASIEPPEGPIGKAIDLAWEVHQEPLETGQFAMGLGWHVARDGQTRWHNGQTGGYHSAIFVNRPLKIGVVVLTNIATDEVDQLAQQIVQSLAGLPAEPRTFAKLGDSETNVDSEILDRYVGKYEIVPGAVFTVTTKAGKLFVSLTGQPSYQVYPRSETEWFYKVVEATLTFDVNKRGKCNAVTLFQNGIKQRAKRIE